MSGGGGGHGQRRALRQIGSIAAGAADVVARGGAIADDIGKAIGKVIADNAPAIVSTIGNALGQVITGAQGVISQVLSSSFAQMLAGAGNTVLSTISGPISVAWGRVSALFQSIAASPVGRAVGTVGGAVGGAISRIAGPVGGAISRIAGPVGGAISKVGGVAGRTLGRVASGAGNLAGKALGPSPLGRIGSLIGAGAGQAGAALATFAQVAQQFVQALNPNAVKQFQLVMSNLSATIGQALLPAFTVVTEVFREASGIISPLAQQLAPVIQTIIQAIGGVLLSGLRALVTVLTPVIPIVQFLADILQQVLAPLNAFRELIAVLVSSVISLISSFGGLDIVKQVLNTFVSILKIVIESLIVFVAYVAKLFGADKVVKGLRDQFDNKGQQGATAAQPAQIKGLEQIAKDLAQASFQAGPGGTDKADPEKEFRDKVAKTLESIDKGQVTFTAFLQQQFDAVIYAIKHPFERAPDSPAEQARQKAVANQEARLARAAGIEGWHPWVGGELANIDAQRGWGRR